MIQYSALAIQSSFWSIRKRADISKNLDHLTQLIPSFYYLASIELPCRLVALAEGALGGWSDDILAIDRAQAAKEMYPEIPGEETDILGEICKQYNFYLIGQTKASDPEIMENQLFNMAFIIDPRGKVILKHRKTQVFAREGTTCPHDIWDKYIEKFGKDPEKLLEAIFPVVRTEIGNIGCIICMEGSYPETARALAVNGAEIIYRPSYAEPFVGNEVFEVQNRAHAIFNTCYVIAPNTGPCNLAPYIWKEQLAPQDRYGGNSMLIDYKGQIISKHVSTGDSYVSGIINITALRDYRVRALFGNYLKDLRVEQYRLIYEAAEARGGIYPKNLWMKEPPKKDHKDRDEIIKQCIQKLINQGVWIPP